MLEVKITENEILLIGRFDASQEKKALEIFREINESHIVNFKKLEYISSAGLSVLLETQKRLEQHGHELTLTNMNDHIHDVFKFAGFDTIFTIK